MTARPPIAQFGDAIEVKGARPSWLTDGAAIQYRHRIDPEGYWGKGSANYSHWNALDWECVTAIRLEVPRYDFVYLALERGMVPWFGGDEAPVEAQLVDVLHRDGRVVTGLWSHRLDWFHYTQHSTDNAIIGYHATSTALPLAHPAAPNLNSYIDGYEDALEVAAHPAAPQGEEDLGLTGEDAWAELVEYDDRTSPEDYPEMCLITRDELIEFMRRVSPAVNAEYVGALAPAAIASGRGEGE